MCQPGPGAPLCPGQVLGERGVHPHLDLPVLPRLPGLPHREVPRQGLVWVRASRAAFAGFLPPCARLPRP